MGEGGEMAIIRWSPMSSLMRWPSVWDDEGEGSMVSDNLDVFETEGAIKIRASVAGVEPDKVEITFEKGILTISAQEEEEEKEGKKYYRKSSRAYSYRVAIPGNIDLQKEPEAKIQNGVVEVSFAKVEEIKPKKIAIKK